MFRSQSDIKVWNINMDLLTDICLQGPLTACTFLNSLGDLIISWKNNLFFIDANTVVNEDVEEQFSDTNSIAKGKL